MEKVMVFQIDDQALNRVVNGRRRIAAKALHDSIAELLSQIDTYGELTGKHTHKAPARRALEPMRDELRSMVEALK